MDTFKLNRDIAYKGKIGKQREDFCVAFIKQKQKVFNEIRKGQIKDAAARGETISCKKGCFFCCLINVEATLMECEAIVYYLYQNETVLSTFLQNYPKWREKISKNGSSLKVCRENGTKSTFSIPGEVKLPKTDGQKRTQNLPCPFLQKQICLIYEVRPYMCAAFFATTPPVWCNSINPNESEVYVTIPVKAMLDLSFYYQRLNRPVFLSMSLAVYEILKSGLLYVSRTLSNENLQYEVETDPEVKNIIQKYQ